MLAFLLKKVYNIILKSKYKGEIMNTKGFLAALLSAAICTASISSASVSATEVKFDIPVCLAQSLHGSVDYKTGTYITNDYVNYRQGYSTAFETYGIIPKGTTVEVTEVFNGWGKINYNGKTAWFSLEYADYAQPVSQTTTTITTTTPALTEKLGIYITTGDVYYRKGHKTESEAYGVIPKGSKVEVLEIYQGWGRTNYEGKDSWFYLKFADFYSESKITNPVTTSTTAAATTTTTTTITTTTSQATVSTAVTTDETPTILPLDLNYSEGDIDGNGIVDASDASTILLYYVKLQTGGVSWFNEKQILFADVNSDKKIDASDASLVLAYYCYTSTNKEFLKMKEWVSGNLVPPVETTTQPITTTTTQNIFTTTASNYTQTSTEKQSTTSSAETTTTTASETTTTTLSETATNNPQTRPTIILVCTAVDSLFFSPAPIKCATTTLAPTESPINNPSMRFIREPVEPTAANASFPAKLPTTMTSAALNTS